MPTTYPAHPLRDLYWLAYDEHVASGGIVSPIARTYALEGHYADALDWFGVARNSDFRTRPFRGL